MRQVALVLPLRILLGVIGGAAVIAGVAVLAAELWHAMRGYLWPSLALALFSVVVILGGVILLQGAWRGRIAVRDPSGRTLRHRR